MIRTLFAFFAALAILAANARPALSPQKSRNTAKWLTASFAKGKRPPFTFIYGGVHSDTFIASWKYSLERLAQDDGAERYRTTYTDPKTGLQIRCDLYAYPDFNAAEWVVSLSNGGTANTPQITNFKVCDIDIAGSDFRLLYAHGSTGTRTDFTPMVKSFATSDTLELHPNGGRSSDGFLPFFNIETTPTNSAKRSGVVAAIGWSGTWQTTMARRSAKAINFAAGQKTFDAHLRPGETVRTPRCAFMLWEGNDEFSGNNKFRRFILARHTHKVGGKPTIYPITAGFNWGAYPSPCNEYSCLTESWAVAVVKQHRYYGIRPEVYWLDAGWYPGARESNWYETAGNWTPAKDRFPNGFRPMAKEIHDGGQKFLVWFEPERVQPGTLWRKAHPEWMLHESGAHFASAEQDTDKGSALMNLANPDAVEWVSSEVCRLMKENGIDYYRQDFNIQPEKFWLNNDVPGRRGITEAKYIEGLYRFWDNILERIPGALIDNCASGGRRIDLETTMRSAPLWRTDYNYGEANGYQCHTYGINLWLPQSGTGSTYTTPYDLRSSYGSAAHIAWRITDPANNIDAMAKGCEFLKHIRNYYLEDYYPLTGIDRDITSDKEFLAYQLNKPSDNTGYILAFRRQECPDSTLTVSLHGLNPQAAYTLTDADSGKSFEATGAELMKSLTLRAAQPRTSVLISYKLRK